MENYLFFSVLTLSLWISCSSGVITPQKPNITETFLTWMIVDVEYLMDGSRISGTGYWAKSYEKQVLNMTFLNSSSYETFKANSGVFMPGQTLFQLQRCDLNSTLYHSQIKNDTSKNDCEFYKQCSLIDMWAWLSNAKYQGQKEFVNQQLDIWEGQITNYTTALLGISPSHPSLPVIYQETDVEFGSSIGVQFIDFLAMEPPPSIFDVECPRAIKDNTKEHSNIKTLFNALKF